MPLPNATVSTIHVITMKPYQINMVSNSARIFLLFCFYFLFNLSGGYKLLATS